jgi:phosphoribosyl 1,2-cyclic phosphodiesterase
MKVCTLASGSSGNATYIEGGSTAVLVDAGLSGRAIADSLNSIGVNPDNLNGILITHEHIDHVKGVGVLSRRFDLKIFASEQTWSEITTIVGSIPDYNRCVVESGTAFEIEDLQVEIFDTSHDAADSVGYSFLCDEVRVGIATDTGFLTRSARKHIDGSDLFVFEANHDLGMLRTGRYPWALKKRIMSDWGHLSNISAGHCLASLVGGKTKGVILAHLSKENNLPELAYSTVANILVEAGLNVGADFTMEVAPRYNPGQLWEIE